MSERTVHSFMRIDCESEYDRIMRNAQFMSQLIEQNQEMERFVNESLIKASGNKRAINEMYILNEAAGGDKIKAFFEKIKNFFKKIFSKLSASISALVEERKKYMDKYVNIITKCKFVASDYEMYNRFQGIPRIIEVADSPIAIYGSNLDKYVSMNKTFDNHGNEITITEQYPYDDAAKLQAINEFPQKINIEEIRQLAYTEFMKSQYWSEISINNDTDDNGAINYDSTFIKYFNGSDDEISFTADQIEDNFQTVINNVYAGESYVKRLNKIASNIENQMNKVSENMEKYHQEQRKKIETAISTMKDNPKTDMAKAVSKNDSENGAKAEWTKAPVVADKAPDGTEDNNNRYKEIGGTKYYVVKDGNDKANDAENDFMNSQYVKSHYSNSSDDDLDGKRVANNGGKASLPTDSSFKTSNEQGKKDQFEAKKKTAASESYSYSKASFFNEMRNVNPSGNSSNGGGTNSTISKGTGGNQITTANKTSENTSSAKTITAPKASDHAVQGINDSNKQAVMEKATKLLDVDIYNREGRINADVQISSAIARAIANVYQNTANDFWKIIQDHVQYYLSNPGLENNSENQTSRQKSLNLNAGSEGVEHKTTETQNAKEEQNPAKPAEGET